MKILIKPRVHWAIDDFYDAALRHHYHTLSFETVENKKKRLYEGIESLKDYYTIFPKARLEHRWIDSGWHEFICEDFHFAYDYGIGNDDDVLIVVHDAIHSLLYK